MEHLGGISSQGGAAALAMMGANDPKVAAFGKKMTNLARCHGSDSYVILPARDYVDSSYCCNNIRDHTAAAMALL